MTSDVDWYAERLNEVREDLIYLDKLLKRGWTLRGDLRFVVLEDNMGRELAREASVELALEKVQMLGY